MLRDIRSARGDVADAENAADRANDVARQWRKRAESLDATVAEQAARIAELELEALEGAGFKAQLEAFKAQHPDSLLLADSGKRFKVSGGVKTKGRLIFEAAFDAKARAMGIANPLGRRTD